MRRPFGRPAKSLWIAALVCAGIFVGYMAAHGICSRSSQTVGSMYAFEPGSLDTFLVVLTAVAGMFGLLFGMTMSPTVDRILLAGSVAVGSRVRMFGNLRSTLVDRYQLD